MIKYIDIVKVASGKSLSLSNSLKEKGFYRVPGTSVKMFPYPEKDGSIRTGLDENAVYIREIKDESLRKAEIAYVKSLRQLAEQMYGDVDLGPRSDFYKKMTDTRMGEDDRAPISRLKSGLNQFDCSNSKEDLIMFAYLRVHPEIAPSFDALQTGKYARARFYVRDPEVEEKEAHRLLSAIDNAKAVFRKLNKQKQSHVVYILGLIPTPDVSESAVYVAFDKFLNSDKSGSNAERAISLMESDPTLLRVKFVLKEAISLGVVADRGGSVKYGRIVLGNTVDNAVEFLVSDANIEIFDNITTEVNNKKIK